MHFDPADLLLPSTALDLAVTIAEDAGGVLETHFSSRVEVVQTKSSPTDVVTEADTAAELSILADIDRHRPRDGVVSEERGSRRSSSGVTWIVDPLDGSVNFLFGIPIWAVSIAVHDRDGPLAAVVRSPTTGETFAASRGAGATVNGTAISASSCSDLEQALVGTGFSYEADVRAEQSRRLAEVLPRVRDVRRAGSAAVDLAWVAAGRLDGFFEAPMKLWDRAAGELLVAEAGGVVTPLDARTPDETGVVAAARRLHPDLAALVAGDGR